MKRLAQLIPYNGFKFLKLDFSNFEMLNEALRDVGFDRIIHLGAQSDVRYSITNPFEYAQSKLLGHLSILEICLKRQGFKHLIYASSSSVYGGNTEFPYSESQNVDKSISPYAATKKADGLF